MIIDIDTLRGCPENLGALRHFTFGLAILIQVYPKFPQIIIDGRTRDTNRPGGTANITFLSYQKNLQLIQGQAAEK